MKEPKSKFPTMGTSASTTARNASADDKNEQVVAKKNTQSGDPVIKNKANTKRGVGTSKKLGDRAYGITAKMPAYKSTEAGLVQGNGRLFKSAINRTAPNFRDEMSDHN